MRELLLAYCPTAVCVITALQDQDLTEASCGDLEKTCLEFLVTMSNKPLLYVPGNHDDSFDTAPPEGCVCIDGMLHTVGGVRFLGFGGSFRYGRGNNMYTEREMARRINRAWPAIARAGGFDVLVTHAPARYLGDLDTVSHRGFECFTALIDRYEPRYFVHGHIHSNYGMDIPRTMKYKNTTIVNAFEHYIFEV